MTRLRIGTVEVAAPVRIYREHLEKWDYRDYFHAPWASARHDQITIADVWRANHTAAGWQIAEVRRFRDDVMPRLQNHLSDAPLDLPPGDAGRKRWFTKLLGIGFTRGVNIARLTKTLHPLVPTLVPVMDGRATPFVRRHWFGLHPVPGGASSRAGWTRTWSLLEQTVADNGEVVGEAVEKVRDRCRGAAPISPFGLIDAVIYHGCRNDFRSERSEAHGLRWVGGP